MKKNLGICHSSFVLAKHNILWLRLISYHYIQFHYHCEPSAVLSYHESIKMYRKKPLFCLFVFLGGGGGRGEI